MFSHFTTFRLLQLIRTIQVALVICGLFICAFAYMRLRNVDWNLLYATFSSTSLPYMQFLMKKKDFLMKNKNFIKNLINFTVSMNPKTQFSAKMHSFLNKYKNLSSYYFMKTCSIMHKVLTIFKTKIKLCVERNDFCDQKSVPIPLIWLSIGLIICKFVICELCLGRIYRI